MFGIHRYRYRFVRSDSDMIALLPRADGTVFFADLSVLRRAGVLQLLAGSKAVEEPDYQVFVRETRFDYARDVQTVAGFADDTRILFAVRGRFDWTGLRHYALTRGGICSNGLCNLPASQPGKWISFLAIQPDVIGLAVARDSTAARLLAPRSNRVLKPIPPQPVWVDLSRGLLRSPTTLPLPARVFAISMQSAERVVLSLDSGVTDGAAFIIRFEAQLPTTATAETIRTQLELQTRALRAELAREHQTPSTADLTGLLVAGTFRVANKRVIGMWPVYNEFLKTLE